MDKIDSGLHELTTKGVFMKKIIIYIGALIICFIFTACEKNDSELSESTSGSLDCEISYENKFSSVDELAEYITENKDAQFKSLFTNRSQESVSPELTVYTLSNVPEGYELNEIIQHGNFISMNYLNKTESEITFVWGFNTDGDVYLKNAVDTFELTEFPYMNGYYYSEAVNDYGENIYQIYWSEDSNCFQLNIPTKTFESSDALIHDNHINIDKTEYSSDSIS